MKDMNFEESMEKLEQIASELENGNLSLEESLKKCAGMDCQQIIDSVKADVAAFVGEAEQSDDITLFTLKRK